MYVMPLSKKSDGSGYRVFWEETSLVGRGKRRLTFEECKKRALRRLEFHGIQFSDVEEEEYCYIPMGGNGPIAITLSILQVMLLWCHNIFNYCMEMYTTTIDY